MASFYYEIEPPSAHYIGGCFWWNWVQDCVPHKGNAIYDGINRCMVNRSGETGAAPPVSKQGLR